MPRATPLLAALLLVFPASAQLAVVDVDPHHSLTASPTTTLSVTFDRPVNRATVTPASFWAFAKWSGAVSGLFSFSNDDRTVTLTPSHPFSAGETVTVYLSHDLRGADSSAMRQAGYSSQFWVRARPARRDFRQGPTMTTRTSPGTGVRSYGGIASDLNRDGFLDITIVNEDSADLRVFLNRADQSGTFLPFAQPTYPIGNRASPSEPSDFNRDGITDICVANINVNSVSILLGLGDGRYGPQQVVPVGQAPRGIAVLDADGDGDTDIVNTNSSSNNLSVLLNNGAGVFGPPAFFEGGGSGEWALASCDMNHDGIMDLIVGARTSQQILIVRANGNGTFSPLSARASGGLVWMLVCGDLNGDGEDDVATVNSTNNNGSILIGDGAGNLGPAQTYATDPFPLACDIGDVDGDGDLDWITSSFDGDWRLFLNNSAGAFAFDREFPAPQAASCCLMFDSDNDGDLDLALIDEIADVVILYRNACYPNCDGSTGAPILNVNDFICFQSRFAAGDAYADCDAAAGAPALNVNDFLCFLGEFAAGCP